LGRSPPNWRRASLVFFLPLGIDFAVILMAAQGITRAAVWCAH